MPGKFRRGELHIHMIQGPGDMADQLQCESRNDRRGIVSSVSTVENWPDPAIPIPEEPLCDFTLAAPMGYAQSKLVASMVLDRADEVSGVSRNVVCVGQIASPRGEKGI
ncbi:hypothetical protein BJX66DRAFT_344726 [Aspergillus keveii]|uniref:Uncharacterized protein n=1 Tax=Aspergillus keveii TaxID=714993 RepID=A0ABR4FKC3_9EURO